MDYSNMSYSQLQRLHEIGKLDPYEALKDYTRMRESAMRQVRRIQTSDVKMVAERPEFVKPSKISSTSDLLHAIADIQQYRRSGNYTIRERRAKRDESIRTMHQHGMDFINEENYNAWASFMEWFRDNKVDKIYGSRDDVIEEFFDDNWEELEDTPVEEWEDLFEEYTGVEIPG